MLERALSANTVLAQVRASKGLREGHVVNLAEGHSVRMSGREADLYVLEFSAEAVPLFEKYGAMPLPPYIQRAADGALAARGIKHSFVTLHVGAGTFAPVRTDDIAAHTMHAEHVEVPQATCEAIAAARAAGGRVIAVGTTVVRSLETAAAGTSWKKPPPTRRARYASRSAASK